MSFSVDRTGRVMAHQIVRSSGHPELDHEVMAMIERAQLLPPFPASMPETKHSSDPIFPAVSGMLLSRRGPHHA